MTKRGLERRIVLIIMPLLLSWLLIYSIVVIYEGKWAFTRQMEREVRRLSATFTAIEYSSLKALVSGAGNKLDKSTWISVYDKKLNCIASTTEERIGGGDDLRIASQTGSQVEGIVREGKKKIYHIITPLFSGNDKANIYGLLEVGTSLEGINGYIFSIYQDTFIIMILGIGILCIVFHLTFRKHIITPIQKLIDWTNSPDRDIELHGEGGIGVLANSMRRMVQTTKQKIMNLEDSNIKLEQEIENNKRELRKAGQDLEEAQFYLVRAGTLSALGEFAAGISHELNNPLGIILGFSQLLLDETGPEHPYYKNLKRIEMESSRCKKIVDDLLNFARPSEPHLEMVQLDKTIDETLQLISYQVSLDNIKIMKKYHVPLPPVLADPSQVEQVFMNIIVNAIQAMPHGGELTITTTMYELTKDECRQLAASFMEYRANLLMEENFSGMSKRVLSRKDVYEPGDKAIKIDISDTGYGVSKENLARLFNPFFTTKKGGTGLGLSICWKLVKKQGGIIGAESIEGEGTTFSIKIPLRNNEHGTDSKYLNSR
jgi:signal transduction histidine kinase